VTPDEVLAAFARHRASAILRTPIEDAAAPAMQAALDGGFRIAEVTLNTPGALSRIAEFAARDELLVGAGTVLTPADARAAVDHGARFLVSPVVDEDVIAEALRLEVPMVPGCHTPTEMLHAQRAGAPMQKLFPVPGAGPAFVRACLGPLPGLRIVPTHGVDETNARAWLDAGAFAVGFVASLFAAEDLAQRRFGRIETRARRLLDAVAGTPAS
jgi:Entner-Doudoroff aldolase